MPNSVISKILNWSEFENLEKFATYYDEKI